MHRLSYAAKTDAGTVRPDNQDSVLADPPVFAVADGIGGSAGGAEASQAIVAELAVLAGTVADPEHVEAAVRAAHDRVVALHAEIPTAGSTLCAAVAVRGEHDGPERWLVVNIGDSRCYIVHDTPAEEAGRPIRRTDQVTTDHSLVQEMIDAGVMDAHDAEQHPGRHVITRAVGSEQAAQPDMWFAPLEIGQRLLLCSDGLVNAVPFEEIDTILHGITETSRACDDLMRLALGHGAQDNVSVIIVDVQEGR